MSEPPGQALFVLQYETLVAGEQVDSLQLTGRVGANRLHEAQ